MTNITTMNVKEFEEVNQKEKTITQLIGLNKKKRKACSSAASAKLVEKLEPSKKKRSESLIECKDVFDKAGTLEQNEEAEKGVKSNKTNTPRSCKNCSYCADHCTPVQERLTRNKRIPCEECKKDGLRRTFKNEKSLSLHMKVAHSDSDDDNNTSDQTFLCNESACNNNGSPLLFRSKNKYLQHMKSQHQIVMFVCEICFATYKLKANFKSHMLTHNIEPKKAFKCEVCNGTFVNKAGFDSHQKRFPGPHIKQTCTQCGISFSKEKHMKNHRCRKLLLEQAAKANQNSVKVELDSAETEEECYRIPATNSVDMTAHKNRDADQIIISELAGQLTPGTQVLQFEVGDVDQPQQVYQVNVADWNMVAPFVIRDPNLVTTQQDQSSEET